MASHGRVYAYGEEAYPCPERILAYAVIERVILDALGCHGVSRPVKEQAYSMILTDCADDEFSFAWWVDMAFEDSERALSAIRTALRNGWAKHMVTTDGRRCRVCRMPTGYKKFAS